MRAWLALREAGVEFEEELIDIRRPQRFANLARIGGFSPPAAVPVLEVDGEVIFDSLAIMEYANEQAGGKLLPAAPLDRARARSVLAWQHSGLSGICGLISFESTFYPEKRALTRGEQAECDRLFAFLEACLARSGGPYLFGALSLADLALVPTVARLTSHEPDFSHWPLTLAWTTALLSRPHVAWWMDEARMQPHVWYDVYLAVPAEDA
jgi:glutathione S-transferase